MATFVLTIDIQDDVEKDIAIRMVANSLSEQVNYTFRPCNMGVDDVAVIHKGTRIRAELMRSE